MEEITQDEESEQPWTLALLFGWRGQALSGNLKGRRRNAMHSRLGHFLFFRQSSSSSSVSIARKPHKDDILAG
jgi:hypothetical protein